MYASKCVSDIEHDLQKFNIIYVGPQHLPGDCSYFNVIQKPFQSIIFLFKCNGDNAGTIPRIIKNWFRYMRQDFDINIHYHTDIISYSLVIGYDYVRKLFHFSRYGFHKVLWILCSP